MLIKKDLVTFFQLQPEMVFVNEENEGNCIIEGNYQLSASYNHIYLCNSFNISIKVPVSYPSRLPQVSSIDNKIPKEFGHFYTDGSLCLGSPMELYLSAADNDISDYLIKHIDAYLYSVTYYLKYNGRFPFGERPHGLTGIIEFWKEYLCTEDIWIIYQILKYISLNKYRGHDLCPCGSQKKVRNCHGTRMFPIISKSLSEVAKSEINLFEKEMNKLIVQQQKSTSRYKV